MDWGGAFILIKDFSSKLFVQHIDSLGYSLWGSSGINITPLGKSIFDGKILSDNDGGAFIFWGEDRRGSTKSYGQRITHDGTFLWSDSGITIPNTMGAINIAQDAHGGIVAGWKMISKIYAQRFDLNGSMLWDSSGVLIDTSAYETPSIVGDRNGGAYLAWTHADHDSTFYDIYAQHIDFSGIIDWNIQGNSICKLKDLQYHPTITFDGLDGIIVGWLDNRNNKNGLDIYAQRLNKNGIAQWENNGIPICNDLFDQYYLRSLTDMKNNYIFSWIDQGHNGIKTHAQKFDSTGNIVWRANGILVDSSFGAFESPPMMVLAPKNLITFFGSQNRQQTSGFDIWEKQIDESGANVWSDTGMVVTTAMGMQIYPYAITNQDGSSIIAWWDSRTGYAHVDVYAQKIDSNGISVITTVEPTNMLLPTEYKLLPAFPNPFNPQTRIDYSLPEAGHVKLAIYDVLGREVVKLVDEVQSVGYKSVNFDAHNLPSSVYFYKLSAGKFIDTKKMMLIK